MAIYTVIYTWQVRCFFQEYQRLIKEIDAIYGELCHYDEVYIYI